MFPNKLSAGLARERFHMYARSAALDLIHWLEYSQSNLRVSHAPGCAHESASFIFHILKSKSAEAVSVISETEKYY